MKKEKTAFISVCEDGQLVAEVRRDGALEAVLAGPAELVLGSLACFGVADRSVEGVPERWQGSLGKRVDRRRILRFPTGKQPVGGHAETPSDLHETVDRDTPFPTFEPGY